jgi:hypothetical protein
MLLFSGPSLSAIKSSAAGADFIALELADGRPRYIFDTGSGPRQIVAARDTAPVNDGRWHSIEVIRSDVANHRGHSLVIDGIASYEVGQATTLVDEVNEQISQFFERI